MENKNILIAVFAAIIIIGAFYGLNTPRETPQVETTGTTLAPQSGGQSTDTTLQPSSGASDSPLSEFQITACTAADRSGTCGTRLERLGLVTQKECCEYLGKCC